MEGDEFPSREDWSSNQFANTHWDPQCRTMRLPENLESCARPVVVETGIEGAAHAAWGSSFLVGYHGRAFMVTARHVLRPDSQLSPLCVRSPTGKLFRPKDVFFVPSETIQEDYADIAVVELDTSQLAGDLGSTRIIPLDQGDSDWESFKEVSPFVVIGFPRDHTLVDYCSGEVVEGLVHLDGCYIGPSETRWIHVIRIPHPPPLTTFSGFSGAPVFILKRQIGRSAIPILAGMALQGSVESGVVRFLDRERIVDMVHSKLKAPK